MPIRAVLTADVSDLRRGTDEARTEFRRVGAEAEGAARQLKAVGSAFDGSRLEGAAIRAVNAVEKIGGVSRLTGAELTSLERKVTEALNKFRAMGAEAPASLQKVAKEIAHVRALEEDLARSTDKATRSLQEQAQSANTLSTSGPSSGRSALLQGAGAGIAAVVTTQALSELRQFSTDIIETAGNIADLSAKTGLTTKQVQTFGYVAAQTGGSLDTVTTAVTQLSNRLVEGTEGTAKAVAALGLSLSELQQMSPGDAFEAITTAIKGIPDPMQQTQLAMELFGRSGAELLPAIKAGFSEVAAEAERLGLVIDERSITALDNMGDAMDRMALGAKAAMAGVLADTLRIIDEIGNLGRAASQAIPSEIRNSPIGRRLQNSGPFSFGAASLYGAATRFTSDYLIPFGSNDLPNAPAARPLPFSAASRTLASPGLGAAQELEAAREALGRLTIAQRQAIEAAKELGATNKEAARAAGTTEAVVRLYEAHTTGAARATAGASKLRAELDKLTGEDIVSNAVTLATNLEKVGTANVLPSSMPTLIQQLTTARDRARELGPEFAGAVAQLDREIRDLTNSPGYRAIFQRGLRNPDIGVNRNLYPEDPNYARTNIAGARIPQLYPTTPTGGLPQMLADVEISGRLRQSIAGINVELGRGLPPARNMRAEIRNLSQAFAQLAQIAGPSFDNISRGFGTVIASGDAANQMVTTLSSQIRQLGDGQGGLSRTGRAVSGGLAGLSTGLQIGSLFTNPTAGFFAGAASGAVSGGIAGGPAGAIGGGIIGGLSALYTANQNRRAQLQAMQQQRQAIISSMGGVDQFREAVERAGFQYDYFLTLFNSSNPATFTDAVNRLNTALQEQTNQAQTLASGLDEVARVQGVLSRQQFAQIRNTDPNGPAAEAVLAFASQQRQQAEQGIIQAVAAIDAATAGGTRNVEQFQSSITATTASLAVLFDTAVRNGESAISVLQRLSDPIRQLQGILQASGQSAGDGFNALARLTEIATGVDTGPLVQLAQGLGQALAGFANTGLLSPELFGELANGIGEAYHQLELFGQGGLEAARLMQPSLQAIWQMIQDTPQLRSQLDGATLALIDFAEQNGLIGEGFRPAVDRMLDALNDLIEKLDDLVDAINNVPGVTVPVTYETTNEPPPGVTDGGNSNDTNPNQSPGDGTYPGFAKGAVVTKATTALIGEAGPEAVVPLDQYRELVRASLENERKDDDDLTPFATGGVVTKATRALIGEAGPEAVIPLTQYRSLVLAAAEGERSLKDKGDDAPETPAAVAPRPTLITAPVIARPVLDFVTYRAAALQGAPGTPAGTEPQATAIARQTRPESVLRAVPAPVVGVRGEDGRDGVDGSAAKAVAAAPGFATGSFGIQDFGKETIVRLHGREAILTEQQLRTLQQAPRLSPVSPWQGVTAQPPVETTTIIGRVTAAVTRTTDRVLGALQGTADSLQTWADRLTAPGTFAIRDPAERQTATPTRTVPEGRREDLFSDPATWSRPQDWGGGRVYTDEEIAERQEQVLTAIAAIGVQVPPRDSSIPPRSPVVPTRPHNADDHSRIYTDEEMIRRREELFAQLAPLGYTGIPDVTGPIRWRSEDPDIAAPQSVVPLSRATASAAPMQITVVSNIDGYEAARAITRHQPSVYRTYGAA